MINRLKFLCGFSILLLCGFPVCAQNSNRLFESVKLQSTNLKVNTNDGQYIIVPYSENIIETNFIPKGEVRNLVSHAIDQKQKQTNINVRFLETQTTIEYATAGLQVKIIKSPFQISYLFHDQFLISEKEGYEKIVDGERIRFNLDNDEMLYGAGARALGMNRRGNRLPLYNKAHYGYEERSIQMNFSIPLVYSSKMYGIHFDNAAIGFLDFDSQHDNTLAYETIGGRKTYQIIAGENWKNLISNYVRLTGTQPLPPRWALGNFASRFGYHSEQEARKVIDQYRAESIPVDAIIFDLYWFGKDIKGTMGNLAFGPDNFPNPTSMISDFAKNQVKTVLITEPFILTTSNRWKEAVDEDILAKTATGQPYTYDFYFGNTGLIDVFKPKAKEWFWRIYKDLANQGVAGVWGDLGEPEVHPSQLQHVNGSADQVHNIVGHEWAKIIAEGYQKDFSNQRPFILMRSGYSGSQKYGMIPWSGDVNRTWGGLRSQTEIALQMGMQGLGYMHSDLGGFAGANLDDELYVRWLQYGVFQPIFRPHAQEEVASEPIFRSEKAKALAKTAIELRYRMLPYNYTLAFENNQTGIPLMRPLFFNEPENKHYLSDASTYLWGDAILVRPITSPGEKMVSINFPKENTWFDFYNDARFNGNTKYEYTVVEDRIPTFVKAGSFVPLVPSNIHLQSTQAYSADSVELHYYHDETVNQSNGQLYDDDGLLSQAYEKKMYRITHFNSEYSKLKSNHFLSIQLQDELGMKRKFEKRNWNFVIHNIFNKPIALTINGKKLSFKWDEKKNLLSFNVSNNDIQAKQIKLKW